MTKSIIKITRGFSLVEMAVVVVIVGLLLGGLTIPLTAQLDLQRARETRASLQQIQEALLGFAQSTGRLPCPATAASNGIESPVGGGNCITQLGYLPAATLGIRPTDSNSFAIDGWNSRIMYAVAQNSAGGAGTADLLRSTT